MKLKTLKLSMLSLIMLGAYQSATAETVKTLPLFSAAEIPVLCDQNLDRYKQQISAFENKKIKKNAAAAPYLAEWDNIGATFRDFMYPVGLYSNLDPDAKLREVADACELKTNKVITDIYQNPKLYAQFKKLKAKDPIDQKLLEDILLSFEATGVQLSADKQKRLKEISEETALLAQDYAKNVRDNKTKVEISPAEMKGLPQSYLDGLQKNVQGN